MKNINPYDYEEVLFDLERSIDVLSKISDGLPDDRETSNALSVVVSQLCNVHASLNGHFES